MFNSDSWQTHTEYRINFKNCKARFSSSERDDLRNRYDSIRARMLALNLDDTGEYVQKYYSFTGRPAKNQAQIIRSLILFAFLFCKTYAALSLTLWVKEVLPSNPVFIALVGCSSACDLPPLGSYFDFMNRFWKGDRLKYSRYACSIPGKNGRKPKKIIGADGKLVEPEPDFHSTRLLEKDIMAGKPLSDNPEGALQDIFYLAAVLPSIKASLIENQDMTLSGDGTAVAVHASPYGRRQYNCPKKGLECEHSTECWRHYSDPDADWGYDSHEKDYYFGRSLYMINYRNNKHKIEVPVLIKFGSAKRHDSILFLHAVDELGRHNPGVCPKNICLDSAHDNYPTYRLLKRWDINALIDMNARSNKMSSLPDDITMDKEAHPHCKAGLEMCNWGYDINKEATKYRCPLACGKVQSCEFSKDCSKSSYGRTIHIKQETDIRYFPSIHRDTDQYKDIYKQRTASERVNNRVLNNYHLLDLKIRGTDHYSFWTMIIGICLHLDARAKANLI